MRRPAALILADDFEAQELYERWVSDLVEPHGCVFASEAERTAKRHSVRAALVDLTLEDCTPEEYLILASQHTSLRVPTLLIVSAEDAVYREGASKPLSAAPFSVRMLRRPFSREEFRQAFGKLLAL